MRRVIALVAALCPYVALAQGAGLTETDLAAAYCLRVEIAQLRELDQLFPCDDPACQGIRAEVLDRQSRLRDYLAARGVIQHPSLVRGLQVAQSRANADLLACRTIHAARCTHCASRPLDDISECARQCSAEIPPCARVERCHAGPFLQGVP